MRTKDRKTKSESAERNNKKPRRFLGLNAFLAFWLSVVACALVMMFYVAPLGKNIRVGDVAKKDLTAPYDIVDEEATEQLRESAKAVVSDVYSMDVALTSYCDTNAEEFFEALDHLPEEADSLRSQIIEASEEDSILQNYKNGELTAAQWKSVLGEDGTNELLANLNHFFNMDELYAMLSMPEFQYRQWVRKLNTSIQSILRKGVPENELEEYRENFINEMLSDTPVQIKATLEDISRNLIMPTMFLDEQATLEAQEDALREITTQYVTAGEPIVNKGETISQKQYDILREVGYSLPIHELLIRWAVVAIFYLLVGVIAMAWAREYQDKLFSGDGRNALLFSIVVGLTLLFSFFLGDWNIGMNMIFFSALLLTQLINAQSALISVFLLLPVLGVMDNGTGVFDYSLVAQSILVTLISGVAGVYFSQKAAKRFNLIIAGLLSGLCSCVVYAVFTAIRGQNYSAFLLNAMWSIAGALLCAIIGIGLMPLFESFFDIATPTRLIELGDPNSPLLQRLMLEAPGTYHHSMMVATLAEACGNEVGANSELLRVAAYYHDIGKLTRPYYFSENQDGENPHDELDALTSASIIRQHVSDSVDMLKQERFPSQVVDVVQQYHGASAIGAFYAKAVKESGDPDLSEDDFRYDGPIPQSKEAAILMIVDSLEASVRAMDLTMEKEISEMFEKMVLRFMQDHQLDETTLKLAEIAKMREAVLKVYRGRNHGRVKYPDIDSLKEELNENQKRKRT